jgi:integrase
VLTFAAARKWCDRPQLWRPKPPKGRSRWASYEEADKLLAACSPHVYRLVLFLMLTGARMSEALELEWGDVSLSDRWVVFRNTKRNGEDRGVPLHPQLVAMLANLRHRSGRVFLNNRGEPYAEREGGGHIKTAWAAACRRAGITDLRPHDLRHTFSTWLTLAGTHEQVRDEIMGHASTSMGRRYSHIPREALTEAVDKLPFRAVPEPGQLWQAGRRKQVS